MSSLVLRHLLKHNYKHLTNGCHIRNQSLIRPIISLNSQSIKFFTSSSKNLNQSNSKDPIKHHNNDSKGANSSNINPNLTKNQSLSHNQLNNSEVTKLSSSNSNKDKSTSSEIIPRVTKEQLLSKTNNFLERLKVRIKWLLKRLNRPYNTDDYSAFFSWLVISNVVLFFVATTTFFSLVILTANTVFAQEFVARKIGEFITKNSSLNVTFENAIVPDWSDGKISFRKVFVSKRPKKIEKFTKGSQKQAYDESNLNNTKGTNEIEEENPLFEDDGNYTQFDLTIEEVNISLSINKWLNGTGMIETLEIKGMRGVVDRTHVHWDPNDDATNYKNKYQPGDFEFEEFKMEDVLFTLLQPNNFRKFDVAIYNCELNKLRKHWLFYDFLNANIMNGSYDNSLFTIHKKQRLNDFSSTTQENNIHDESEKWKRVTRMRVDSLNIDHLNTGLEGPFGWITNGKVDMIGDVMVPKENNEISVSEIVSMITESIKKEATRYKNLDIQQKHPDMHQRLTTTNDLNNDILKYFVLDLTIKLNNVRATVPFKAPELSYINYALIRPIVAYINSKNTFIEIHNRIIKNLQDFSGSWTIYDSLLMDDISEEVYDNFVEYVADEEARLIRMKRVGFWSLQLLVQLIIFGVGTLA